MPSLTSAIARLYRLVIGSPGDKRGIGHDDFTSYGHGGCAGEALNGKDILLSTLAARRRDPSSSICKPATTSEPGILAFTFDIVLLT